MGTITINPTDIDRDGEHSEGDKDFWGSPLFRISVYPKVEKDEATGQTWLVVKIDANWREQNPDHTTYKVAQSEQLVRLNSDQQLGEVGNYQVILSEREIRGTNQRLVLVYDGERTGNKLVHKIQVEGDKKGQVDTPKLVVLFNKNVKIPMAD
jgi:hypothetical protein